MTGEEAIRVERAGLAAWRAAETLRQVRERFPEADDPVARLSRELEELARTLTGECAMRLREAEAPPAKGEP